MGTHTPWEVFSRESKGVKNLEVFLVHRYVNGRFEFLVAKKRVRKFRSFEAAFKAAAIANAKDQP